MFGNKKRLIRLLSILLLISLTLTYSISYPVKTKAAAFSKIYVFLNKIEAASTTGGTICVQPGSQASPAIDVKVTWPGTFTLSGTPSNWTAGVTNLPADINGTTPTAWPGISGVNPSVSGQDTTWSFSSTTLATTNIYCFRFGGTPITLPSATSGTVAQGTVTTQSTGPATIDSGNFGMAIVSGTDDQITVTSTVGSSFSFALGTNSLNFGTLPTTGTPGTVNTTMTISTSAANGWSGWIKSANAGLTSSTTTQTIASVGTYPATTNISGTEGYQLNAVATTGSPTIAPGYLSGATTTTGGKLDTFYQNLATMTTPVNGAVVTLNLLAEADPTRLPASDYNDTLTVIASGAF